MSMHKIPLTPLEEEGLRKHGLAIGTPSQLSDAFRLGMKWQATQSPNDKNATLPITPFKHIRKPMGYNGE